MLPKDLIKKLNEAGVDPTVIVRLMLDDEPETVTPDDPQDPAPAPAPAPAPEPAPAPAPEPPAGSDKILEAIERLTGAVQAANIRSMSAGDPAAAETADEILASIISPKKGGK